MKQPLRFKRKKRRVSFLRQRFFWYGTGLLFLLMSLFYAVVFSSWLNVQEIKFQGTSKILPEHILSLVEDNFWQEFLGIPTNSILLFDIKDMEEKLSFVFPAILRVTVQRSLPQTLVVKVEEREQIVTWCSSTCFAIDAEGVLFKEVEEQGEYVVLDLNGEATLGQELLKPSLLALLLDFKERFQEAGESLQFSTAAFEIGQRKQVEAITQEGWRILLDLKENMEWQQTKLELVLQQKVPQERREELEYIDLRFGDQAYVKYFD